MVPQLLPILVWAFTCSPIRRYKISSVYLPYPSKTNLKLRAQAVVDQFLPLPGVPVLLWT